MITIWTNNLQGKIKSEKKLNERLNKQASSVIKTELQKINKNTSDYVEKINDESILKVICKRSYDDSNIRACLGVHIPTEKKFDKVIIEATQTIATDEYAKILLIIYGLQQSLKVTKQYPTKYKQIDIYIYPGIAFFENRNARNRYLLDFPDSYKIEIDDLKNELTKRDSLISIYEKQSLLDKDSILSFNTSIANLKNENQDSSLRNSNDFSIFLKYFISKVYSEKNFDSLVYHESVILRTFINNKLGIFRTFNPGVYRAIYGKDSDRNYGYYFHEGYNGEISPNISNFLVYSNKLPKGGFCDEATSPDGIYYNQVFETPSYDDPMNGKSYSTTAKYKNFNKKIVHILNDKFIKKTLYFVEVNKKWYLLFIDDCDCSA